MTVTPTTTSNAYNHVCQTQSGIPLYQVGSAADGSPLFSTSPPKQSGIHTMLRSDSVSPFSSISERIISPIDKIDASQLPNSPSSSFNGQLSELFEERRYVLNQVETAVEETAKFFQDIVLKDEHLLKIFMKHFPNIDLHMHIDGSLPSINFLTMAKTNGLYCRVMEDQFEFGTYRELELRNSLNVGKIISAEDLQSNRDYQRLKNNFYEIVSMRGAKSGTTSAHYKHFFQAFNTLESIAKHIHLKDKLTLLLNNIDKHVKYIEPSIWFEKEPVPKDFVERFNMMIKDGQLNQEKAKALLEDGNLKIWIDTYVEKARAILDQCKVVSDTKLLNKGYNADDLFSLKNPCVVRFIIDNDRTIPCLATVFAHFAGSMTLQEKDNRVVGSGFAGEEFEDNAINHYDDHMNIIEVLKKCYPYSKLSLHAGELIRELSFVEEPLQTNVRKAVMAGADRIGHAVCITEDPSWLTLFDMIKEQDVHIECCLKSNENILGITNGTHPIGWFVEKGISWSLCTDDPGVNNSSPASEMEIAAQRYNTNEEHKVSEKRRIGYKQFKKTILNAARQCFLPGDSIYHKPDPNGSGELIFLDAFKTLCDSISLCLNRETGEWERDVSTVLTKEQKQFLESSEKAMMQLEFEKAFIFFEQFTVPNLKKKSL